MQLTCRAPGDYTLTGYTAPEIVRPLRDWGRRGRDRGDALNTTGRRMAGPEESYVMSGKHHASKSSAAAASSGELRTLQMELAQARALAAQLQSENQELRRRAQEADSAQNAVAELSRELHHRTMRMEQQLAVARQFQRLFVPPALPQFPDVRFAVKYQASPRVGGDLYDVFDMGNSCVGVFVADASGYGLTATLITAVAKMALDTFRQNEYSPRVILEKVNDQVLRNTLENQFLTAFLGVIDLETMRMKFVNAAHPMPVIYGKDRFETLDTEGLCCGMFEEPKYEEREVQLQPGDRVFFYTRGLIEMCNTQGAAYDCRRLHNLLTTNADLEISAMIDRVAEDFAAHMCGNEQIEDLTLVGLEVLPREVALERIVIPSEPMQLSRVESVILGRLEALNYGERATFAVRLALEEAVVNAIKHGNRMDKAKRVTITYSADDRECVISVEDEGPGFDPAAVPDPTAEENIERPSGRGLMLIRAYMDEVSHDRQGRKITMRKKAPWAE